MTELETLRKLVEFSGSKYEFIEIAANARPALKALLKRVGRLEAEKNQAYKERNILASISCKMAKKLGYKSGVGKCDNEDWDDEWRNVIYIDLPEFQISYHIAPDDLSVLDGLQKYDGKWDGKFSSKEYTTAKQALEGGKGE